MNKISKRNIALAIVLTIITGGVYAYYWQYKLIKNTRVVQGTTGSCVGEFLCFMFVPFYALYWWFTRGNSVEQILSKQGYHTSGSGILYLILSFFGLQMVSMAIAQYDFNGLPDSVVFKPGANTIHKTGLGAKASRIISNTIIYILLVAMTLIWLFPFFGLVMESFKVDTLAMDGELFPKKMGFDNYVKLFKETDFLRWFINTGVMGIATAAFQTVFILTMSYTLSRLRFKGRKGLMNLMLILGMFPGFLTMILIYKVFADLGLTMQNAPIGLIIVYCASSGMGYYVSKGFFDTIPKTLDEAARVDGATRLQVLYKVILPLSKPIVIYTILMGFMAPWGDFMLANYLIHENSAGMNVAVGMFEWTSTVNLNEKYTMFCAAGVLVAVPVTAVFLALQKYYVEGVTGGAVKG